MSNHAPEAILAVDQGTTNTKCLCVLRSGEVSFSTSAGVTMQHGPAGHMQQSPEELWQSVVQVLSACVRHCRIEGISICGIAISNQRETALCWERTTMRPIAQAISWQCRRSAAICDALNNHADTIRDLTGLPLDPLLSATKWRWLLTESGHTKELLDLAQRHQLCLGTVDTWLIGRLTSGIVHATDHTNASRTGLLHLTALAWDRSLLELFDIPCSTLPALQPSANHFGLCTALEGLEDVPIVAAIGDSHAALVGHGALDDGDVKVTYGTGSSLMMPTRQLPETATGLARTVAWTTPHQTLYALEGNIAMTGGAVASVSSAEGLIFVPAMAGLGAPSWNTKARGSVQQLEPYHRAAHLAYAAVEAIAMQVTDVYDAMAANTHRQNATLHVDGGASRNDSLLQMQADLAGCRVLRTGREELSALGAARLGGFTLGWWALPTTNEDRPSMQSFSPSISIEDRERRRAAWRLAVHRCMPVASA
jgi:glycerol kinase